MKKRGEEVVQPLPEEVGLSPEELEVWLEQGMFQVREVSLWEALRQGLLPTEEDTVH
jgi:hypothetical protein